MYRPPFGGLDRPRMEVEHASLCAFPASAGRLLSLEGKKKGQATFYAYFWPKDMQKK